MDENRKRGGNHRTADLHKAQKLCVKLSIMVFEEVEETHKKSDREDEEMRLY